MSTIRSTSVTRSRRFAGIAAAIVVVDAMSVGAPGLALMTVPFLIIAIGYRDAHRPTRHLAATWCALYLAIAVNFVVANGVDAPWGDLLFAFGGSAAVLGLVASLYRVAGPRRAQASVKPA